MKWLLFPFLGLWCGNNTQSRRPLVSLFCFVRRYGNDTDLKYPHSRLMLWTIGGTVLGSCGWWEKFTRGESLFSSPYSLLPGYWDVNSICHLLLPSWPLILTLPWHIHSDGLPCGIEVLASTGTLALIFSKEVADGLCGCQAPEMIDASAARN